MKKIVSLVIVVLLLSVTSVAAQQPGPGGSGTGEKAIAGAVISEVEYDFSVVPWLCVSFTLEVTGMAGGQVRVALFPYYSTSGELIQNMSGLPSASTPDGMITDQYVVDIETDNDVWDRSAGYPFYTCTNADHYPLLVSGYDVEVLVEVTDEATGTLLGSYDTVNDLGAFTYGVHAPLVRVSNVQYDFEANLQGEPGILARFTFETLGYEGHKLQVVLLPVELSENAYIASLVPNSAFTNSNGSIFSTDSVTSPYEYTIWADWLEGSQAFELFLPYSHFPDANFTWYPEINVIDLTDPNQELLLVYTGYESEFVEMYSSQSTRSNRTHEVGPKKMGLSEQIKFAVESVTKNPTDR